MAEAVREELSTDRLVWIKRALGRLTTDVGDGERVDQIRLLEEIKAAAAGAQAQVTHDFAKSQRAEQHAETSRRTRSGWASPRRWRWRNERRRPRAGSTSLGRPGWSRTFRTRWPPCAPG